MDYARALVEHPMWAWHIGMVAERGARVYDIGKGFAGYEVPDINHPATKGWLLHWLMESGRLHSVTPDGVFVDQEDRDLKPLWFPNEAAALLAVWGDAA